MENNTEISKIEVLYRTSERVVAASNGFALSVSDDRYVTVQRLDCCHSVRLYNGEFFFKSLESFFVNPGGQQIEAEFVIGDYKGERRWQYRVVINFQTGEQTTTQERRR
ncbi:MAG: hypothetical protein M0P97_03650 [Candidatus Moranbacteria bacterium]|jgi:hypothetical protein|nr:hypothetical protein [Candidatus Moranbacteria bacterium]